MYYFVHSYFPLIVHFNFIIYTATHGHHACDPVPVFSPAVSVYACDQYECLQLQSFYGNPHRTEFPIDASAGWQLAALRNCDSC